MNQQIYKGETIMIQAKEVKLHAQKTKPAAKTYILTPQRGKEL